MLKIISSNLEQFCENCAVVDIFSQMVDIFSQMVDGFILMGTLEVCAVEHELPLL